MMNGPSRLPSKAGLLDDAARTQQPKKVDANAVSLNAMHNLSMFIEVVFTEHAQGSHPVPAHSLLCPLLVVAVPCYRVLNSLSVSTLGAISAHTNVKNVSHCVANLMNKLSVP